jgi:hypothetical protein
MPGSWKEITIEIQRQDHQRDYKIAGKTVIVKTVRGMKEAPLSGLTPLYLAKMLLRELSVQDTAASGGISGRLSITLSTKPKSLAVSAVIK